MSYQNQNWTTQFKGLPEGWDTDPAVFNKTVEEYEFACEGENCPIKGHAVANDGREGNLYFVKLVYTSLAMEEDGVTPKRDKETGQKFFGHEDLWRHVFCYQHTRWAEGVAQKSHEGLSADVKKRGDKVEAQSFPLFKNLRKLAEMSRKGKRSERVAKFFLSLTSLTEGADISVGVGLDCIKPFDPATPKDEVHNYLIHGGKILGLLAYEDVRIYHGVRHQHKAEFIAANLYLYTDSTLVWVEERLVEWRKTADENAATESAREAKALERRHEAEVQREASVSSRDTAAAEVLALIKSATTPSTEPTVGGSREGKQPKQRKQRKSAPPSAARQIDEQLDAGERATLASDTPDVIIDEHAGETRPTSAVALGDRPEVARQLAAARIAIEPTE